MSQNLIAHAPQTANSTLVRQSLFFSGLPQALLSDMAQNFRLEEWPKGAYIDPLILQSRFHILLDGKLEMRRGNPDTGREITLEVFYPGDSFDVITLLDGKPHDVILEPLTNLKLISTPMENMRHWLLTYPELNGQFMPYLAKRMRDQEDLSASFALYDVATRLGRIILKQINKIKNYTGRADDGYKTHLLTNMSDELLARMVGSVRQVVNKHLTYWKQRGILDKKRNQLVIKDLEALEEEADMTDRRLHR